MSTWERTASELAAELRGLSDGGFVTVVGPSRPATGALPDGPARPGLLSRLFGGARTGSLVPLLVQFLRQADHLYAECVAGPSVGGEFPWTPGEHDALLAGGWQPPPGVGAAVYIRFYPDEDGPARVGYLDGDLAEQAADLAVRTLRDIAGVTSPDTLERSTG